MSIIMCGDGVLTLSYDKMDAVSFASLLYILHSDIVRYDCPVLDYKKSKKIVDIYIKRISAVMPYSVCNETLIDEFKDSIPEYVAESDKQCIANSFMQSVFIRRCMIDRCLEVVNE